MSAGAHGQKVERLAAALRARQGSGIALRKDTSNLFRDRASRPRQLDVRDFTAVLQVDPGAGWVEAEGMAGYEALVEATLPQGVMPAVVPQLKSITLGGAAAGVGIEASSFKYGLVHHTLLELDVLTGEAQVVRCTPDNEHRDLFFGFPNSYGTLGYALRIKARTAPVKRFVRLQHLRYGDRGRYFEDLARRCGEAVDFVDGVVFGENELYLTLGRFVDEAPYTSDYTWLDIYYRSIRERSEDFLTARDFIWRWDTDWFWCSRNLYAQNPLVRRLAGRRHLNSVTYGRIMRWNARVGLTRRLDRLLGVHAESVIQDVDIPLPRAAEFLEFFHREIGILPIWICPIGGVAPQARFDLYPLRSDTLYVNFGFWDVVKTREARPPGWLNRKIERAVAALGGIKSLYSDSYFGEEEFGAIYGGETYRRLKRRYDPQGVFPGLYDKCVRRH